MAGHFPWGASPTSAKWCLGRFMRGGGKAAPHLCPASPCLPPPRALLTHQTLGETSWAPRGAPCQAPSHTVSYGLPFNYMYNCLSHVSLPAQM